MAVKDDARRARTLALDSSTRALGVALAVMWAGSAWAQTPPPDNASATPQPANVPPAATETPPASPSTNGNAPASAVPSSSSNQIVVTGFRASLQTSIATKRRADEIVESVSAEDIGKLPDNSIADAIARLPGLTAQRVNGRDQVISIRGLAPDFSTTLLNGREQVSTGDNRAVEYDLYPAELIGGVDVYKTPYAGLVGQGLSGTVDLKTIRPLEYGKRAFSVNARGEALSTGRLVNGTPEHGYRVSANYIDQFADDTLGVTFGVSHEESPTQFSDFGLYGYSAFSCLSNPAYNTGGPNPTCKPAYAAADGKQIAQGFKPFLENDELNRTGVLGTVEWKPSDHFTMTFDGFYSKFKEKQLVRGVELPVYAGSGAILAPDYTINKNGNIEGTFDNVKAVVRNQANTRDADLYALGWNGKYTSNGWTLDADISYSSVKRRDQVLESYAGTGHYQGNGATDTLGFSQTPSGAYKFTSTLDYTDPGTIYLTDPQGYGQEGYLNQPSTRDHLLAFKGSVSKEFDSGIKSVEIGGYYTDRKKTYSPDEYQLFLPDFESNPGILTGDPIPSGALQGAQKVGYTNGPSLIAYDPFYLLDHGVYDLLRNASPYITVKGWEVREKVATGWVRANLDQPVGAGTLTGNIGVEVVYTDQSSTGDRAVIGAPNGSLTVTEGKKYTEILPSMNLVFRFDDHNVLRFGAARTLARARMDQMKASFNVTQNPAGYNNTVPGQNQGTYFGASGGTPGLKPWIADGVDLSYEHYFNAGAYVAAAFYYRYLETYIYSQNTLFDFTGYPYTPPTPDAGPPATFMGIFNRPVNGQGGTLYGAELSGTLPFSLLTPVLDGFGVTGSFSYTTSSITPNPGDPSQPLPGLSKYVTNATLYYEKGGFSARASVTKRSKYLAEISGYGVGREFHMAGGETVVDAQVGYDFKHGFLKGLGVLFQAQNLTNAPFYTYSGTPSQLLSYQKYGTRYLAGVSYKF